MTLLTARLLAGETAVWKRRLLLLVVLAIAGAGGVLAGEAPLLAIIAMVALAIALAVIIRPDAATMAVIFILYSNVAVIAVNFHGLPYIVGVAFPFLLSLPLIHQLLFKQEEIVILPALPFIVLYLGVQLLGAIFSINLRHSLNGVLNFVLEGLLIYVLIANVVRTPKVLRQATWALLVAGMFLSVPPLFQQVTGTFENDYGGFAQVSEGSFRTGEENLQGDVRQPRLSGAIGEQNRFAQIMFMLVPLGLFIYWSEGSRLLQLLALIATALISVGVVLTFSRGAAVAAVILLFVMLLLRTIKTYQFSAIILVTLLLILLFPQYSRRLETIPTVTTLLSDDASVSTLDGAIRGRATAMMAALLVFADHPVVGVGPEMFQYYSQEYGNDLGLRYLEESREAHNLYLGVAANTGALGLIAFMCGVIGTLWQLVVARRKTAARLPALSKLTTGYLLAVVSYLATGLFLHLSYGRYFWLMLALAGAAAYIAIREASGQVAGGRWQAAGGTQFADAEAS